MNIVLEILVLLVKVFLCYIQAFIRLFYAPKKDISGKTAVLTGGGGGIGKCIAEELAKRKVRVALWDVDKAAADKVREELIKKGFSNIFAYQCDVTKKDEVKRVAAETRKDIGEIDFLFNNAGVFYGKDIMDLSEAEISKTMDVNIVSQFWTIREFLPSMLKKNYGHIVNIASIAGKVGLAWFTDYCASKYGVVGLSESLRLDIERRGKDVKVTTVCPFFVDTPFISTKVPHIQAYSRFDKFVKPDTCAKAVVEGMEKNDFTVYVPANKRSFELLTTLMPRRAMCLVNDFGRGGVYPKNMKMD